MKNSISMLGKSKNALRGLSNPRFWPGSYDPGRARLLLILVLGLTVLMLVSVGCSRGEGDVAEALDDLLLRAYLAFNQGDISEPASDDPTPVVFVVEPGDTAGDIALRLKRRGLVTDGELFRQLAQYEKADNKLEAGRYELRANMTMREIIEALQHGRIEEVAVTIPEGWRIEQIAEMLVEEVGVDGDRFLDLVQGDYFDHEFLQHRPPGATLRPPRCRSNPCASSRSSSTP